MSSRKEEEDRIKERERKFRVTRTAKPGAVAVVSGAVAVSEPDTSGSFTVPSTASASSNVWGTKETPPQAPSTASSIARADATPKISNSSPKPKSARELEDERTKERERAARIGTVTGLAKFVNVGQVYEPGTSKEVTGSSAVSGASSNVWGKKPAASAGNSASEGQVYEPGTSKEVTGSSAVSGASSNVWGKKPAVSAGNSGSAPRSTSPKPSDSSNVWGPKKTQAAAPVAAARDPIPPSSKGPSTRELEDRAIKERERGARMTTVTTNLSVQARSSTATRGPTSEPDMPAASGTRLAAIHVPGVKQSESSSTRDPIQISSTKRITEQEDEQIKDRERQLRTGTAASGPAVSTIRPGNVAVSTRDPIQITSSSTLAGNNKTTSKGLVDEDEKIKARERQNRTAHVPGLTTLANGNVLTAGALQMAAPDVELVEMSVGSGTGTNRTESSEPRTVKSRVEEDERIKAFERQSRTARVSNLEGSIEGTPGPIIDAPQTQNPNSDEMMFQSVVSEAYVANPVDRSANSSGVSTLPIDRSANSSRASMLPEKSRTGPRMTGVGASPATGESTQPGVVRDDSAAEEMIRAKRGRHAGNLGVNRYDHEASSMPQIEDVEISAESVEQAEEEYVPKGAFRVYGNGIIVQQQPGTLADHVPESVPEYIGALPPPDPEEPNDGPTSVPAVTSYVPDETDDTVIEGKSEVVPFYASRKYLALIGIILLAAIAIGVGVALSGGGGGGGDVRLTLAPTIAPTEDPIFQERGAQLTIFLENEGLDVESLEDPSSYQTEAFNWIVKEDETARLAEDSTDEEVQVALSRYVLAVFYYSLNGSSWNSQDGWLDATLGHCSWEFISCDGADLITHINTGSYLKYIEEDPHLPFLNALSQGGNQLEGIFPSELKHLTSLVELHLQNNLITGIDGLHEGMSDLKVLSLGGNQIADMSMVYTLTSLEILNMHETRKVGGSIDTRLGRLSNLRQLILIDNGLTGSASTVFNQMGLLEKLHFDSNRLEGDINELLSGKSKLEVVTAADNLIDGELGVGISNWTNMTEFVFSNNKLTGSIPSEIGRLDKLFHFNVNNNELTGSLPSELGLLGKEFGHFDVSQTSLSGSIPPEFWELSKLQNIFLDFTSLKGTIPDTTCGWGRLEKIRVDCFYIECNCGDKCQCA